MSKRKTIVCPYCCSRYSEKGQFDMWFRSEKGPDVMDENLKRYYMDVEHMGELDAGTLAIRKRAVHIDWANHPPMEGDYNRKQFEEYGFVREITYDGEKLCERLCPHCHNELPYDAGFYDMKMIGLYGDTSVGKTVYLTILEALLRKDPYLGPAAQTGFHGRLEYLGAGQEKESHKEFYDQLIDERTLYEATRNKGRVQPQTFLYTYERSVGEGTRETRRMLLVFCDIPGENTRDLKKLRRSGFYLRSVDGILLLLDPTRLSGVHAYMRGTPNDPGENIRLEAEDSLNQLAHLLQEENEKKISIPTAVVITKLDALRDSMRGQAEIADYQDVLFAPDANRLHEKFLNRIVITRLNKAVRNMISRVGGAGLVEAVGDCFDTTSYFTVSALGKSPVRETVDTDNGPITLKKIEGNLAPYRVTEPFYWLMAQFGCIPYLYREVWKYTKKGLTGRVKEERTETIQFFYYATDRLNEMVDKKRKDKGINPDDRRWERQKA